LGALISSLVLLIGSAVIIVEAVNRLMNPETINTELVIWFAVFGIIVNGLAAMNSMRGKTMNEKIISLHMLEDVLGWLALLITAIVMHFTQIMILDSLLSIGFTLFIVFQVFKNIRKILAVFLEKAPKNYHIGELTAKLETVPHVEDIHHLHLWTLDGEIPLITLHAKLEDNLDADTVSETQHQLSEVLKSVGIQHSTIQIEFSSKPCLEGDCQEADRPDVHTHHHNH